MKKSSLFTITCLSLSAFAIGILTNVTPVAAATNSGQALEIAPPVITLSANPGETVRTEINLRDVSNSSLVVKNQINDFVAGDENGTPKILLDDTETNPYSLKNWINPLSELTLKAKQIKNLPVTISVPANAAPGGYYGVIRFTGTPPDLNGTGVSLSASLGSLILLTVKGDAKEALSVKEFSVNSNGTSSLVFESAPLQFKERLQNTGNIHEQPVGQISITDMFNKKIATVNVNLQQRNILPQSIREFTQPLDSSVIGNKILFGRYKADLKVTYGTNKTVVNSSLTFWVIPFKLIGLGIIVLVGGFITLRFLIRRYNNHIISKARK